MNTIHTALLLPALFLAHHHAPQDDMADIVIEATHVAGSVHMLTGRGGNIGVSIGADGPFVVDDQFAPLTTRIQAAIAKLVSKDQSDEVRFVVNTHWHGDHTGGNGNLAADGAVIVAHANARERMLTPQASSFFGRMRAAPPAENLPFVTFTDEIAFRWNDEVIRAIHVERAHTDGDAILHFEKANVLHMGDTFFNGMYPFVDVDTDGSVQGLIGACDRALALCDKKTKVIPGHGPLGTVDDLRAYRGMLAEAVDLVSELVDAGLSNDEILAEKPTRVLDERWGKGFIKPEAFLTFLLHGLASR
jgi:glyoxylase-like metal-dependent hydrolase (beta-lactamase superfamily II)